MAGQPCRKCGEIEMHKQTCPLTHRYDFRTPILNSERVEPDVVRQRHEFYPLPPDNRICQANSEGNGTCCQPREAECHVVEPPHPLQELIDSQVDLDPVAEKALNDVVRETTTADDPYYGQPSNAAQDIKAEYDKWFPDPVPTTTTSSNDVTLDTAQESVPERIEFEIRDGAKVSLLNVPKAIWLQTGFAVMDAIGGDEIDFNGINHEDLTWCQDSIEHGDIKFARDDIANAAAGNTRAITVESALAETRKLFPRSHFTEVSEDLSAFDDDAPTHRWMVIVQEQSFFGATLDEAMSKVREFAAKEGK